MGENILCPPAREDLRSYLPATLRLRADVAYDKSNVAASNAIRIPGPLASPTSLKTYPFLILVTHSLPYREHFTRGRKLYGLISTV